MCTEEERQHSVFEAMKEIQFDPWKAACNEVKEICRERLLEVPFILAH